MTAYDEGDWVGVYREAGVLLDNGTVLCSWEDIGGAFYDVQLDSGETLTQLEEFEVGPPGSVSGRGKETR